MQQGVSITHKVTVRYLSTVTAEHRALLGSRVLNFRGVRNVDERGITLEIDAEEGE
jgi:SPP1 family predicted phage head-tail adaptor